MKSPHLASQRRHSLFVCLDVPFLALAFAFSWTCWLPAAFAIVPPSWNPWLHLLGALGPMAAGWVRARSESANASSALRARCRLRWRHWPWVVSAALIPLVLYLIGAGAVALSGQPHAAPFTARSSEFPSLPFAAYALVSLGCYGFGEEVGWRGWWLPKLRATFTPRHTALIQGLTWVLWHLPLLFISPGYRAMSGWMLLGWALSTFFSAALFVWLFKFTQGSVIVAAVFHATMDIAFLASPHPVVGQVLGGFITLLAVVALLRLPPTSATAASRHW